MLIKNCQLCQKKFKTRATKQKFCTLTCANRFNINGLKKVILPNYSVELAEFVGIFLGDGWASRYQVAITLNSLADKGYVPYVVNLAKLLFPGATVSVLLRKGENSATVKISSVIASRFLRKMCYRRNRKVLPKWIFTKPSYMKACIRDLFDTEGSISYKVYRGKEKISLYKQLNFRNFDLSLMKFVRDSLQNFGFRPTNTLKGLLYLSNDKAIDKFREEVGFSNPKLFERSFVYSYDDLLVFKRRVMANW